MTLSVSKKTENPDGTRTLDRYFTATHPPLTAREDAVLLLLAAERLKKPCSPRGDSHDCELCARFAYAQVPLETWYALPTLHGNEC